MTMSIRSTKKRFYVPGLVLAAWTVLLWSTRVRNALDDATLVGWSRTWQVGVSVLFLAVAVLLAGLSLVRPTRAAGVGVALAIAGSIWWTIRGIGIVIKDYEPAFTIVHVILAIGTIVISGWLLRGEWRQRRHPMTHDPSTPGAPRGFSAAAKSG